MTGFEELELSLKRSIFKDSYHEFFKWSFNILFPTEKYEDSFHIKYLCDKLQDEVERIIRREERDRDLIVNIPPRTSKSLICSVCLNAWAWIRDPSITFISVSFDEDLTLRNAQYCKDIIKSDEYQRLFGDIFQIRKDEDSKSFYMTNKGGFRMSKTTGSNITGHKGVIIIIDDPQNPKTAESEIERKNTIDYFTQSLYNRLTPIDVGVRVIVMQRLHESDLTGYCLKEMSGKFEHICLPAEESPIIKPAFLRRFYTKSLLDPVRLSKKTLGAFKVTLGSRGYAGQYGQTPNPEEGGIIKPEWFTIVEPETVKRSLQNNPIHFFIDSAYTAKQENDPTAILAGFRVGNYGYILDTQSVRLEFPDLIKYLKSYVQRFQISSDTKIFIEPKASGKSIAQTLKEDTTWNIIELQAPDTDKIVRTHSQTPKMEAGRIRLIKGGYISRFLEQCKFFPNGEHDDEVDTLYYFCKEMFGDDDIIFV